MCIFTFTLSLLYSNNHSGHNVQLRNHNTIVTYFTTLPPDGTNHLNKLVKENPDFISQIRSLKIIFRWLRKARKCLSIYICSFVLLVFIFRRIDVLAATLGESDFIIS